MLLRVVVALEILMGMTRHILEVVTIFMAVKILFEGVVVVAKVMDLAQLTKFVVDKDTLLQVVTIDLIKLFNLHKAIP